MPFTYGKLKYKNTYNNNRPYHPNSIIKKIINDDYFNVRDRDLFTNLNLNIEKDSSMARKTKKATRPMCEKIIAEAARKGYRNRGKDYNKKVFMSDAPFTPAEIQLLKSQNRWIDLPFLHNEA